jgi:hypothetical protein
MAVMVTRSKLAQRSELKARKLLKKTLLPFCVCVAIFLCAIMIGIILNPNSRLDDRLLSVGNGG